MSGRDTSLTRRRLVLGTVGMAAALAGCLGADTPAGGDDTDQGNGESTPTPESSTPSNNATQTSGEETTPESSTPSNNATQASGEETTPEGSESVCAPLAGNPTAYDVSGTLYVFAFDYPETWTVGEPIPGQNGRFQQITSPAVTIDGNPRTATVRVGQTLSALSASEVEAETEELMTRDIDPFAVVDEQTFDGETVDVLGFPDIPPPNYPPAYVLHLPYGTGDSREYYRTNMVTYSDIYGLEDGERDACNGLIRTATETVRSSLRPNPDTTVEDA